MFCFLGVVFFTVGLIMNVSLSKHFPEFYQKYKCLLWTATLLLTIPLFIRTAKDYMYYNNDEFANWYEAHLSVTNTVFAILTIVLPIVTQTASLVFGYMRNMENKSKKSKKDKEYKGKEWLLSPGNGGSGEGETQTPTENGDDSLSSTSDSSNVKISYFDPPIERFAFVQKFGGKKDDDTASASNMSRSIAGSQLLMKKPKGRKKKSAGTGNDGNSASDMSDLSDTSDNRGDRASFPGLVPSQRPPKKFVDSPNSDNTGDNKAPFFFHGPDRNESEEAPNFPGIDMPGTYSSSDLH